MQESSVIHFDGDPGELWDTDALLREAVNWTSEDWTKQWELRVQFQGLPAHAWRENLHSRYNIG